LYDCSLIGLYVGISRKCTNGVALGLAELMAFDTVVVEGTRTASLLVYEGISNNGNPSENNDWDVTATQNLEQSKIKSPRPWGGYVNNNASKIGRDANGDMFFSIDFGKNLSVDGVLIVGGT
jgi:hypothetical protein